MSSNLPDDGNARPPPINIHIGNSQQHPGDKSTARASGESGLSSYWHTSYSSPHDRISIESHIDPTALQAALPPDIPPPLTQSPRFPPDSYHSFDGGSQYVEESTNPYYADSDRVPLTAGVQPISGSHLGDDHGRESFQTVRDLDSSPIRDHEGKGPGHRSNLGYSPGGHQSYGLTLDPGDFRLSRSASTAGAFQRAGSIVRAMSQRVVNLSGESDVADQRSSRYHSRSRDSSSERRPNPTLSTYANEPYYSRATASPAEKGAQNAFLTTEIPTRLHSPARPQAPNPLRGKSLGIFSPESRFRVWMCDLLVNPYTEPFILILIVSQTILLAVESWPDVFSPGNARPEQWGNRPIDWTMLALFIIFTLEIMARIVVSGFILNAEEYSTIDRKRGIRAAVADRYKSIFQPQRQKSTKRVRSAQPQAPAFARSFTTLMQGQQTGPKTVEDQQRFQLARRAFLRHSFNRLDFVAVVSFWITFVLAMTGTENRHHFYLFQMLSCLRILRLLALTHGTAVSTNFFTLTWCGAKLISLRLS